MLRNSIATALIIAVANFAETATAQDTDFAFGRLPSRDFDPNVFNRAPT